MQIINFTRNANAQEAILETVQAYYNILKHGAYKIASNLEKGYALC